ncbi:hypothetical protein GTQ40_03780 [Flavobacteriaceae bacterium R38]|nr:hypothetical protein [Flavobacteriaceae bacterium R38]
MKKVGSKIQKLDLKKSVIGILQATKISGGNNNNTTNHRACVTSPYFPQASCCEC